MEETSMSETATAKSAAKALLLFTLPLIMSGLFQQLFNWVDAFIVGNVEGELALAGILRSGGALSAAFRKGRKG